ncbi:MAG: ABC transporter permease subunit [Candidatus Eiseniibacteriota bacterium]
MLVVLVVLPFVLGDFLAYQLALYFLYAIAALGIGLTWGQAGFLPLGQAMFIGIAAYLSGHILKALDGSLALVVLLPLAALVPGLLAYALGLLLFRGRRESGPYFTMITLALTLLVYQIATNWNSVTGGFNGLKDIPGLPGMDDITDAYPVAAVALFVAVTGVAWLVEAPLGVLWRALAQNERRVAFFGFDTGRLKAAAFGASGVLGGIAGVLYAPQQGLVTPELSGFMLSADLVIWAAVGGRRSVYGPVLGAVLIGTLTAEIRDSISWWSAITAALFIVVVLYAPDGFVGLLAPLKRFLPKSKSVPEPVAAPVHEHSDGPARLEIDDVTTEVGEVRILDHLSFAIDRPGIFCIIGPNGAGKTSTFNMLTGELPAESGHVRLDGAEVTGEAPNRMTRRGIGRKFQIPNVFPELSIADNLSIALWGARARPLDLLKPRLRRWASPVLDELRQRFPFLADGTRPAGALSHGERQILELVMALATEPRLLLLDEPCAGLSHAETRQVIDVVRWAGQRLDSRIVIIEHDMALVKELADHVFVLHQGTLLAAGSVDDVRANPAVQAVYVGGTK